MLNGLFNRPKQNPEPEQEQAEYIQYAQEVECTLRILEAQLHETTICDIDLFRKAPVINDKGIEWFGTKRLKAPEEYMEGSEIDEQTNIFTLGALIFDFFGKFSDEEIHQRYCNNQFVPCSLLNWQLSAESYRVATKAVSPNKSERYLTLAEFFTEWKRASSFTTIL